MTWINRLGLGLAALALACAPALAQTISYSPNTLPLSGSCGTVTAVAPCLDLTQTWNNAGVTFYGFRLNVTDTASASASLLMDMQVAGASKFSVKKNGDVTSAGGGQFAAGITAGADVLAGANSARFLLGSSGDVILARDAANTLALRNGVNGQTFRIYNTFTDTSNGEWADWNWNTNTFRLAMQSNGTGLARNFAIQTAGTDRLFVTSGGLITLGGLTSSFPAVKRNGAQLDAKLADDSAYTGVAASYFKGVATTVAGLVTCNSSNDGIRQFVTDATATTFASAVAGGGSNHVPVYCDGSGTPTWKIG